MCGVVRIYVCTYFVLQGIVCAAEMVVLGDDEFSRFADSSGNSDSSPTIDPEVPRADFWTCVQCKNENKNPLFRYCEECYKVKYSFISFNV